VDAAAYVNSSLFITTDHFCCGFTDRIPPFGCGDSRCTAGSLRCVEEACEGRMDHFARSNGVDNDNYFEQAMPREVVGPLPPMPPTVFGDEEEIDPAPLIVSSATGILWKVKSRSGLFLFLVLTFCMGTPVLIWCGQPV